MKVSKKVKGRTRATRKKLSQKKKKKSKYKIHGSLKASGRQLAHIHLTRNAHKFPTNGSDFKFDLPHGKSIAIFFSKTLFILQVVRQRNNFKHWLGV